MQNLTAVHYDSASSCSLLWVLLWLLCRSKCRETDFCEDSHWCRLRVHFSKLDSNCLPQQACMWLCGSMTSLNFELNCGLDFCGPNIHFHLWVFHFSHQLINSAPTSVRPVDLSVNQHANITCCIKDISKTQESKALLFLSLITSEGCWVCCKTWLRL